jgi:hypothetical protein
MLLRKKTPKLQSGGSIGQAQNEYVPIENTWGALDLSGFKTDALKMPNIQTPTTGGSGAGQGLPSDVLYADAQIDKYRTMIKNGITSKGATEYGNSSEFKQATAELQEWTEKKASLLKPNWDDYKATSTRLSKSTNDDYAVFGSNAFVKDNSDQTYKIVDFNDVITARMKGESGGMTSKYSMATVGEALKARYSDSSFSGFNEQGEALNNILANVLDSDTVTTSMNKLFNEAGKVDKETGMFLAANGAEHSISDMITELNTAASAMGKPDATKLSNASTLGVAVQLFKNNMNPNQLDSLKNKATATFMRLFGNKEVDGTFAQSWIAGQVNADIANRAKIFLATSGGAKKTGSGAGAGTDKKINTNAVALKTATWDGETLAMEVGMDGTGELAKYGQNVMGNIHVSSLDIAPGVEYNPDKADPKDYRKVGTNQFIRKIAGGGVARNLFLGNEEGTRVSSLNDDEGLTTSVVDLSGDTSPMKILKDMPYTTDKSGNNKIAWDVVEQVAEWGAKVRELENAKMEELIKMGRDKNDSLDADEMKPILEQASKLLKFNPDEVQGLKIGDIAMIPLLVQTSSKDHKYDSSTADAFATLNPSQEAFADASGLKGRKTYATFGFSVLDSNSRLFSTQEAFGPTMEIKEALSITDIIKSSGTAQRITREGFNINKLMGTALSAEPVTK